MDRFIIGNISFINIEYRDWKDGQDGGWRQRDLFRDYQKILGKNR